LPFSTCTTQPTTLPSSLTSSKQHAEPLAPFHTMWTPCGFETRRVWSSTSSSCELSSTHLLSLPLASSPLWWTLGNIATSTTSPLWTLTPNPSHELLRVRTARAPPPSLIWHILLVCEMHHIPCVLEGHRQSTTCTRLLILQHTRCSL
jgi:hypothetical protein